MSCSRVTEEETQRERLMKLLQVSLLCILGDVMFFLYIGMAYEIIVFFPHIDAGYDLLNTNANNFNVSIWYNATQKNDTGNNPLGLVRVSRSLNVVCILLYQDFQVRMCYLLSRYQVWQITALLDHDNHGLEPSKYTMFFHFFWGILYVISFESSASPLIPFQGKVFLPLQSITCHFKIVCLPLRSFLASPFLYLHVEHISKPFLLTSFFLFSFFPLLYVELP